MHRAILVALLLVAVGANVALCTGARADEPRGGVVYLVTDLDACPADANVIIDGGRGNGFTDGRNLRVCLRSGTVVVDGVTYAGPAHGGERGFR